MSENNGSHAEHTTEGQETQGQDELNRLLGEVNAATHPFSQALRKRHNGHDVDMTAVYQDMKKRLDAVYAEIAPQPESAAPTYTPPELIATYWDRIAARGDGMTTGLSALDEALAGGFEPDRLAVLLGAPGSGKTTLSNQIAVHAAENGRPVLYVTSEDQPHILLAKTIARLGWITYTAVQRGFEEERYRIDKAMQEYGSSRGARFLRYLDATQGLTLNDMAQAAKKHFDANAAEATGAPLLVVDYLQRLARGEVLGADLRQSVTVYTERLRAIACDLHCTVLVLSAMNRASGYHAHNSTIASAKESGDIDYTADIIMAIGEKAGKDDEIEDEPAPGVHRWLLRVDKNRQGMMTYDGEHIELDWTPMYQWFNGVTKDDAETASPRSRVGSNGRYGRRARS